MSTDPTKTKAAPFCARADRRRPTTTTTRKNKQQKHAAKMMIKVKTLTGKTLELDIEPNDKVERIKERIEQVEGE